MFASFSFLPPLLHMRMTMKINAIFVRNSNFRIPPRVTNGKYILAHESAFLNCRLLLFGSFSPFGSFLSLFLYLSGRDVGSKDRQTSCRVNASIHHGELAVEEAAQIQFSPSSSFIRPSLSKPVYIVVVVIKDVTGNAL